MTTGKVQTVLGLIEPEKLGRTLTHEHIHVDFRTEMSKPQKEFGTNGTASRNLGWIRQNQVSHPHLLALVNEPVEHIIQELMAFKREGGRSIVDNTSIGIQRNVELQKKVSLETGLNFICGTGYFLDCFVSKEVKVSSIETLVNTIVREVTVGVDDTNIKCGVIGEVGCSWPMTEFETKSLQAAAIAQTTTGAPVILHPGHKETAPIDHIRVFQEAGGDVNKTVMSHIDRTIFEREILLDLATTGCYLEFDMFGMESHHELSPDIDMPSDSQRIQDIKFLISEGYEDKILMSHDIYSRDNLVMHGGHGYSHIQVNIIPKMRERGVSQEVIDQIQIGNPKTWLTFK